MHPKILLVDDREDNLVSIEAVLTPDDYHVFKARSGTEALRILLGEVDFALILMDVKMPILDGFETANLIHDRENLKSIPIIFITANNYGDENIYRGYQSGGIDYILKPINPEILRAKVAVFASLYRKSRMLLKKEQKLQSINEILGTELTVRKASEDKLKKENEGLRERIGQLEAAKRELERLTVTSANDFRDPLMKIESLASQLQSGSADPVQREVAKRLQEEIERMKVAFQNPVVPVMQVSATDD